MKVNDFKCWYLSLSKHKGIEFQISRWEEAPLFGFTYWLRRKQDHPGLEVCLTLFRHEFRIDFYDCRHWNMKSNDYEKYED